MVGPPLVPLAGLVRGEILAGEGLEGLGSPERRKHLAGEPGFHMSTYRSAAGKGQL